MRTRLATRLCGLFAVFSWSGATLAEVDDPRELAKQDAWNYARVVVAQLERGDNTRYPAIAAWLRDYEKVRQDVEAVAPESSFPKLDSEKLVTRNPNFWAASFEVAHGDPGFALLHSSLLLCGGEAQRAAVFAALGLQRPDVPEDFRQALGEIIAHARAAQARSFALVQAGVKLHDARTFGAALEKYDQALAEWPANGWAAYERGLTLRMKALAEVEAPLATEGLTGPGEDLPSDPPEVIAAFAQARRHDPFQIMAYQGEDPQIVARLMTLVRVGLPIWETIRKQPDSPVTREQLRDLSEACRDAEIPDFAVGVRQQLLARNFRLHPDDTVLVARCLRQLAPASVDLVLARLESEATLPSRLIVDTGHSVEPLHPVQEKAEEASTEKPKVTASKSTRTKKPTVSSSSKKKKSTAGSSSKSRKKRRG